MPNTKPKFNKKAYKHAISMVESAGGKYLKNGNALGRYQFIYRYIKDTPEMKGVSKRDFMNNRELQEKIMDTALDGKLKNFTYGPAYAQKFIKDNNANISIEDATALVHFLGPGDAKKAIQNPETFKVPGVNLTVNEYLGKFKTNYQRYQKHENWMNQNQSEENPITMAYDQNGMAILREDKDPNQPYVAPVTNNLPEQPQQNIQGDPAGFSPEGVALANLPDQGGQQMQAENMPNAGGVMRIENQDNVPSLQDGFLRLEDQMKVQGLELTGQKSDPQEDRYQQNQYFLGGQMMGMLGGLGGKIAGAEEAGGIGSQAPGAEGGGPGIGAYVGAAGTALQLGQMAFGKPDVDTSGMTAPEEVPSKGSAALSGAMAGASAGMAFGPWGAAIGGVVGGAAGLMGNKKAEKAQDKAHLNYTSRKHSEATGMYELGGTLNSYDSSPVNGASELVTMFENGGTHEQNSLGGIPQGMGANGKPNLVEEGETKFEDYIFSNNINMDGTYSDKEDEDSSKYKDGGNLYEDGGSSRPPKKRVKQLQTLLFNEGLLTEDQIDGFWGTDTQGAYESYEARTSDKSTSGLIPLQIKSLWNDITGSNPNSMDSGSLDDKEMDALQKIVRENLKNGRDKIMYKDYETDHLSESDGTPYTGPDGPGTMSTYDKLTDPMYKLKTTLGQAKIIVTPQNDTLVMDTYDFNNNDGTGSFAKLKESLQEEGRMTPYNIARQIGTNFGSKDKEGATVLINTNEEGPEHLLQQMIEENNEFRKGGMLKRADGSYSKRGLWDNIRANKGSGKKPTAAMLAQERKINKKEEGGPLDPPTKDSSLKALRAYQRENNPERMDGETDSQYKARQDMFLAKIEEGKSSLDKAWESVKEYQEGMFDFLPKKLAWLPQALSEVITSPVDLAYGIKKKIDIPNTERYKTKEQLRNDNWKLGDALLDNAGLLTAAALVPSLTKKTAFNLSKQAAVPLAVSSSQFAARELAGEAAIKSAELGTEKLMEQYAYGGTLSDLTRMVPSKGPSIQELLRIKKRKELAAKRRKKKK